MENDTLIWLSPSAVSFIQSVNEDSFMVTTGVPEIIPVSASMLRPSGRDDDDSHEPRSRRSSCRRGRTWLPWR